MNATTVSSWYVKLAGEFPFRISQKMHSLTTSAKLNCEERLFDLRSGIDRRWFRLARSVGSRRCLRLSALGRGFGSVRSDGGGVPVGAHLARPLAAPPP